MGKETYGQLADDRINGFLDWDEITDEATYEAAVKDFLEQVADSRGNYRGKNITQSGQFHNIAKEMYLDSGAMSKITVKEQEKLAALRKAQLLEAQRSKRSREADERKTHKVTREATKESVKRWKRGRFRRMDVRSVDTKRRALFSPKNLITRKDVRLKNIRVFLDKKGIKRYQYKAGTKDINGKSIGGRFRSSPWSNTKRTGLRMKL